MKCTACATETTVLSTRSQETGIYRRRECPACGARFSTMEQAVGLKPGPKPSTSDLRPARPVAAKPAPRSTAPARRLNDRCMRTEPHDYTDDLREAGIDTTHFG